MKTALMFVVTLAFASCTLYGETAQPPPPPAQEQPEVLTSGPVHEAFAEPVDMQPEPGLVAPEQPPANIQEIPPAERPQGSRYAWVPGYWAWDGDRNTYIWVSGCWRIAPPNSYWVPGYWVRVPAGWQWIPGFWSAAVTSQIEYLPAPPAIETVEAPGPPPVPDNIWVPPCWYWYQGGYVYRSGYWLAPQPDWVWVPSHYVWTPRGYVFIAGHWDYPLEARGVLFAPCYFPSPVYVSPGFVYSPSIVVDLGWLTFGLFTYPHYCHYYFGDYYDDAYISIGIFPWFEVEHHHHRWYDPIYVYDRWHHRRTEPRWEENERREYDRRRTDRDLRPPRTYREMETRVAKLPEAQRRDIQVARPLTDFAASKQAPMKFERIRTDQREKIAKQATEVHKFGQQRSQWESRMESPGKSAQPSAERKAPVTAPSERKEPAVQTPQREKAAPSAERKTPAAPPVERKETVTPPAERKTPAAQPPQRAEPVTPSAERKTPAQPPERKESTTQAERVNIPTPPVSSRRGLGTIFEKGPPSRPANERKTEAPQTPKEKGGGGDTSKDKGERGRGR